MHPLAQTAVRALLDSGARLDPLADFDDLAELNRLAEATRVGWSDAVWRAVLNPELRLKTITLRRLSIGMALWWEQGPAQWYSGDDRRTVLALMWCMAHAREPAPMQDAGDFWGTVEEWALDLRVDFHAAEHAVAQFLDLSRAAEKDAQDHNEGRTEPDYAAIVEGLCKEYAGTPHGWTWERAREEAEILAIKGNDRVWREMRASGKNDPDDPYHHALRRFYTFRDEWMACVERREGKEPLTHQQAQRGESLPPEPQRPDRPGKESPTTSTT